jgi:hypothetical protein
MDRAVALKRLHAILGANGRYRVSRHITSPERRAAAAERYQQARAELTALQQEMKADIDQRYGVQLAALQTRVDRAGREKDEYRFWVGRAMNNGLFTMEVGKGDTWEETLAMIEKTEQKRAVS